MPNSWAMIDSSFPTFTGKENYRDQVHALQDYLYLVVEELKYKLANLNAQNWNKTALERLQKETVAPTNEEIEQIKIQLTSITTKLTALTGSLNQLAEKTDSMEEELPKLWEGLELLGSDIDSLTELIHPDGEGGATIGAEGKAIRLVGNIYINGVLYEQEVT